MTKFEDHLWREFVREHGHDLAQVRRAAARPSLRPRVVAAGGLGLAGAGVGLALALGATTAAPAFAVTRNHDGTVTVDILRSSGVAGANAKLHQLGIRAEVMSTPPAACSPCATRGPVPSDHQRSLDHQPAHDSRSPDAGAHSGIRGQQREQRQQREWREQSLGRRPRGRVPSSGFKVARGWLSAGRLGGTW